MGGLTQIRRDGSIFQHIDVLDKGVRILDLFQCLCDERRIIVTATGLRTYTYHQLEVRIRERVMNHTPLIPLSPQT